MKTRAATQTHIQLPKLEKTSQNTSRVFSWKPLQNSVNIAALRDEIQITSQVIDNLVKERGEAATNINRAQHQQKQKYDCHT